MSGSVDQFRDVIRAAGMTPPDVIEPGTFHRFPGAGKRNGNTAGWCKLFPDCMGGIFGDYSRDLTETWQARRDRPLTLAEREGWREHVERTKAEAEAKRRDEQAQAAKEAAILWKQAAPARAHAYLARKAVGAHGVRVAGDTLLVPMRDSAGELWNVERIPPSGQPKKGLPKARRSGCYHSIGKPNGAICIGEGYATGASLHEATGHAVAAAFDAGNLELVARELRAKYPDAPLILCADNDAETPGNPGLTKATAAARAVGGLLAVPTFTPEEVERWKADHDGKPPTDFNDLFQIRGAEAVKEVIGRATAPDMPEGQAEAPSAAAADSGPDQWPEPQPLSVEQDCAAYPTDALPDGIREAVVEVVGFVQCPPALAACSALSALSLAGQALANVQRAERLEGPVSLYLLAVADSGERKTTCDGYFLSTVREWEREQAERTRPEVARQAAVIAAWQERKGGIQARIRDASKKGDDCEATIGELADVEAEEPQPFRVPRVVHADATPEALAWALATGWPSGGIMSSEAGIVFGGHGMGRDSVMRNLSLLNALWDGTSHRVERRASDSFTVTGARLTMGLAAQPETVRQFMEGTRGLARGNGFAARFLIAAPQTTQGTRLFRDAPAWRHLPAFASRVRALLDMPIQQDESGALAPPMLALSDDARVVWIAFHDAVEGELRPGGDMADARDVASKAADNVARLAALFHLYARGPTGEVAREFVESAARIVGWHLYQARAFLGDVGSPREVSNARRLDGWLLDYCRREGITEVERRTIQNRGPNPVRGKAALDAALAELAEAGRIRAVDDGRRKLIVVNPALVGGGNGAP
jgi:putative DNA primase/helicase